MISMGPRFMTPCYHALTRQAARAMLTGGRPKPRGVAQAGSAPALGAGGRPFKSGRPDHAGVAQLGRASAFQAEGRGFESRLPLQPGRGF